MIYFSIWGLPVKTYVFFIKLKLNVFNQICYSFTHSSTKHRFIEYLPCARHRFRYRISRREASRDHALLAHHMIFNKDYAIILCLSTAQERAAFLNYPGWLAGWLAGWLVGLVWLVENKLKRTLHCCEDILAMIAIWQSQHEHLEASSSVPF